MLKDTNLPLNWRELSSDESTEEHSTLILDGPADGCPYPNQDWLYSMFGWNAYYNEEGALEAGPAYPTYPADVTQVMQEALEDICTEEPWFSYVEMAPPMFSPRPVIMSYANRIAKTS